MSFVISFKSVVFIVCHQYAHLLFIHSGLGLSLIALGLVNIPAIHCSASQH